MHPYQFPRIVLILIAIFTNWYSLAFVCKTYNNQMFLAIFGWFFMPYTVLAYIFTMVNNNREVGGSWFFLILAAIIIDLNIALKDSSDNEDDNDSTNNSSSVVLPKKDPSDLRVAK